MNYTSIVNISTVERVGNIVADHCLQDRIDSNLDWKESHSIS